MSLLNSALRSYLMKTKTLFDPENPPDYPARRKAELMYSNKSKVPRGISVSPMTVGSVPGELTAKAGNAGDKLILHLHGGGFVSGSAEGQRSFNIYLARKTGLNVYSPDYALAPEHPFPEGLEDCVKVYAALVEAYGAKNLFVIGGSAGGNLVLASMLKARDSGLPLAAGLAVFSPTLQYLEEYKSYTANQATECMITNLSEEVRAMYFGTQDASVIAHPYGTPLNGDFTGFPPVFITVSDSETLRDDSYRLRDRLKDMGVTTEFIHRSGMIHAYTTIPAIPEAGKDIRALKTFLSACGLIP